MKRRIIAAIAIVCILLGCVWIYNRYYAYVIHYNLGNMYDREYSYASAIKQYEKALEKNIPEGKECRIRINLALAMMDTLGTDFARPDQVDNSIMILKGAKNQLLADNCATEEETGHSAEAEQLKKEIDAILEQLYEKKGSGEGDEQDPDPQEEPDTEEMDAKEQSIREELAKMQEKAYQDREADRQFMQEYDYETIFDYEGDIW